MGRKKKVPVPVMGIDQAFINVVDAVATTVREKNLTSPVDIKLEFKQVGINNRRFLGFGKSNQKNLSITLATRIVPEDIPDENPDKQIE